MNITVLIHYMAFSELPNGMKESFTLPQFFLYGNLMDKDVSPFRDDKGLPSELLDTIFCDLQRNRYAAQWIDSKKLRSMSVGDIVTLVFDSPNILETPPPARSFVCDVVGWRELPGVLSIE